MKLNLEELRKDPLFARREQRVLREAVPDTLTIGCERHDKVSSQIICRSLEPPIESHFSVYALFVCEERPAIIAMASYNADAPTKFVPIFPMLAPEEVAYWKRVLRSYYEKEKANAPQT